MAETDVYRRVSSVFTKNKAFLRGVIKQNLSSFLSNQDFLTEEEKIAAQDAWVHENKRLGDLMKIIEDRISVDSEFFPTILYCLNDSACNLDNVMKEIEEAKASASAHSSISGSIESHLDQSSDSFDGSVDFSPPQLSSRRQSTGDIPSRDLPSISQTSPSHKGAGKRPSSASGNYDTNRSPYTASGSSKKISTPTRPGSRQRKWGGSLHVSPVHVPRNSGSSESPSESPLSLSGSFKMGTIVESPVVKRKLDELSLAGDDSVFYEGSKVEYQQPVQQHTCMSKDEKHDGRGTITDTTEDSMLNKMEEVNDLLEKTRSELVTGFNSVYTSALQDCRSLIEYYQRKIHQLREETTSIQREQSREINVQRSNVQAEREAREELERLIDQKDKILQVQQEDLQELREMVVKLNKGKEQLDEEKLKCDLAAKEKELYEQDQRSNRTTEQIKKAMQEYGIPDYDKARRLADTMQKWKDWEKVGEDIERLSRGEAANVSRNFIQQAVYNTKNSRRPRTSLS